MGGLISALTEAFSNRSPNYTGSCDPQMQHRWKSYTSPISNVSTMQRPASRLAPVQQRYSIRSMPVNRPLRNIVLQQEIATKWSTMPANKEYVLITVAEYSDEYIEVSGLFKNTTQKQFKVTEIKRIQNPYLLGCYLLKKHEMQILYGAANEKFVFHGTKRCNIEKICGDNFNWRLHGNSTGNRYGKGVSFSPISCYASNYSDKNQEEKVMFLVRILYNKAAVGNGNMTFPPIDFGNKRFDTTGKADGQVLVKFCDNEFYPEYLIYYTGSRYSKKKVQNRNHLNSWNDDFY